MKVSALVLHEFLSIGANDIYAGEKWIYDTYLDNIQGIEMSEEEEVNHPLELTQTEFYALQAMDIKKIVAETGMSENHIGGDDVISIVDETIAAIKEGYEIITWYGPKTQALIVGVRPNTLEIEK